MMIKNKIRVVELFAGVGGFRLGFEQVDKDLFETVWANQWEPSRKKQHAYDCYAKNFGTNHNCINDDITKVKFTIPDHDLLVGGFPCQDYSVASSNAKGIEGKKGVLWWEIRDIIENKKPSMVFLENVDRLLKSPSKQRGRDFGVMLRCFDELGYFVEWKVVNAADYGHPQKRRRVFIFAYRKENGINEFTYHFKEGERASFPGISINEAVSKISEGTVKCGYRCYYGTHVIYIIR
jgi:DNA (cytosine-5)-methyltransferase 1